MELLYDYNKDEIKNSLTIEQVTEYVAELGGEPNPLPDIILCKTICHGGDSHKLYYYDNTKLFKCYTGGCSADGSDAFDIFELTRKVMSREQPKAREDSDWNLPEAIEKVAQYFHLLKRFLPHILGLRKRPIQSRLQFLRNAYFCLL